MWCIMSVKRSDGCEDPNCVGGLNRCDGGEESNSEMRGFCGQGEAGTKWSKRGRSSRVVSDEARGQ